METVTDAKSLSEALSFLASCCKGAADDFDELYIEPGECEELAGLLYDLAEHATGLEGLAGDKAMFSLAGGED